VFVFAVALLVCGDARATRYLGGQVNGQQCVSRGLQAFYQHLRCAFTWVGSTPQTSTKTSKHKQIQKKKKKAKESARHVETYNHCIQSEFDKKRSPPTIQK
jgi:hypothetical protein